MRIEILVRNGERRPANRCAAAIGETPSWSTGIARSPTSTTSHAASTLGAKRPRRQRPCSGCISGKASACPDACDTKSRRYAVIGPSLRRALSTLFITRITLRMGSFRFSSTLAERLDARLEHWPCSVWRMLADALDGLFPLAGLKKLSYGHTQRGRDSSAELIEREAFPLSSGAKSAVRGPRGSRTARNARVRPSLTGAGRHGVLLSSVVECKVEIYKSEVVLTDRSGSLIAPASRPCQRSARPFSPAP